MIDQMIINNFRGFSSQRVSDLRRVNLIVGKNSSGKTAFLESIFISAGAAGPNVTFTLHAMRQLGSQLQLTAEANAYQALWRDLFHWFEQDKTISIEIIGTAGDSRALHISYSEFSSQLLPFGSQPSTNPTVLPQIVFEWKKGDEPSIIVKPKLTSKGLEIEGASVEHFPAMMFGPHITDSAEEVGKRFSELSKEGKSEIVLDALKVEYPFLDSLSIEYSSATPVVFASFKGNRKKLPIALISDGINKLLSILLGIACFPRGTILIDQIEDGFYFDRMSSIWNTIYRFAKDNDSQIFATTHSMEFLKATRESMHGKEDDFSLLHAQRDNGSCNIRTIKGKFLEASLEQGIEVR